MLFAGVCYTLLAPWQFRRHEERAATNAAIRSSFSAPPVPLADLRDPAQRSEWRLVTLTGNYLPDGEVLARLRSVRGEPAFEVLTPFRMVDGRVVLIDRGFVKPVSGVRVPEYSAPPGGQVELTARLRSDEVDPEHRPAFSDASTEGRRHVYAIESQTVARATGITIEPGYLRLESGAPGVLEPLPLPDLQAGPFLSYALQWIAFATMALLALGYFSWREVKPGGALAEPASARVRRKSVAELVAEEEAAERADHQPASRPSEILP
jgi:cytochrome oxidase assembly protein ShyY1